MSTRTITFGILLASLSFTFSTHAAPKRYLVQFKSPATFYAMSQSLSAFNNPLAANGSFVAGTEMKLMGTEAAVTESLPNLQMLVVQTEDQKAIDSLKSHPAIAIVEEEFFHPAPEPLSTRSPAGIQSRSAASASSSTLIPMPWGVAAVRAPQAWRVTRGAGARVLVLDTGIDQGHPALQSRIEAVQNFTGGDPNDVTDDVGHGSHVSGTILADGANGGLIGVAPEAKLLMGKICTEQGCSSVGIASGLDWAVQQKVDVVNMSLGGMFMSNGEALAVIAAESAGVMIVAASGNDGKPAVSYPGAAVSVLAVGAVDSSLAKAVFSNWGPQLAVMGPGVDVYSSVPRGSGRLATVQVDLDGKGLGTIKSSPLTGSPAMLPVSQPVVFANLGKPEDFAAINVAGKFALIARGEITFKDKVANAFAAGAIGAIIFDNAPGLASGKLSDDGTEAPIPAVMIEQSVGLLAKSQLQSGKILTATMGILKTDYMSFQGTSMATPHVAGVAALVRAANHTLTPAQVRALLKSTATPLLGPNDMNQLGAGLVNAEAAVNGALSMQQASVSMAN